jgi:hypothetical protein
VFENVRNITTTIIIIIIVVVVIANCTAWILLVLSDP